MCALLTVATGDLSVWSAMWGQQAGAVQWAVVVVAALAAAITDLLWRKAPNRLTGPLLLGGFVMALLTCGPAGLLRALSGCVLLAAPYVLLFLLAGGGAGDAKLMGGIGAWLGPVDGLVVLAAVCITAIVQAAVCALWGRRAKAMAGNVGRMVWCAAAGALSGLPVRHQSGAAPPDNDTQKMPYAVSILGGVIAAAGARMIWPA